MRSPVVVCLAVLILVSGALSCGGGSRGQSGQAPGTTVIIIDGNRGTGTPNNGNGGGNNNGVTTLNLVEDDEDQPPMFLFRRKREDKHPEKAKEEVEKNGHVGLGGKVGSQVELGAKVDVAAASSVGGKGVHEVGEKFKTGVTASKEVKVGGSFIGGGKKADHDSDKKHAASSKENHSSLGLGATVKAEKSVNLEGHDHQKVGEGLLKEGVSQVSKHAGAAASVGDAHGDVKKHDHGVAEKHAAESGHDDIGSEKAALTKENLGKKIDLGLHEHKKIGEEVTSKGAAGLAVSVGDYKHASTFASLGVAGALGGEGKKEDLEKHAAESGKSHIDIGSEKAAAIKENLGKNVDSGVHAHKKIGEEVAKKGEAGKDEVSKHVGTAVSAGLAAGAHAGLAGAAHGEGKQHGHADVIAEKHAGLGLDLTGKAGLTGSAHDDGKKYEHGDASENVNKGEKHAEGSNKHSDLGSEGVHDGGKTHDQADVSAGKYTEEKAEGHVGFGMGAKEKVGLGVVKGIKTNVEDAKKGKADVSAGKHIEKKAEGHVGFGQGAVEKVGLDVVKGIKTKVEDGKKGKADVAVGTELGGKISKSGGISKTK